MEIMTRRVIVAAFLLATLMSVAPLGRSACPTDEEPAPAPEWFRKLPYAKPKYSTLHFYIQDILTGPDVTFVRVADAGNVTAESPTRYGLVNVVDVPFTVGPDMSSGVLGHAEGLYVAASKLLRSTMFANNFVFTSGQFNDSSISVMGRIAEYLDNREFPISGGSGAFRLAEGIASARVYSINSTNMVVECTMRIKHY